MVTPSSTEFEVLVGEIDGGERVLQQCGLLHRLALEAVGKTLAAGIGLGEFVLVVPAAVLDQMVDVRAIGAVGIAEHAQRRRFQIAMVRGLIGQRVLANEILLDRLVGGGRQEAGFREQLDLQRQQVAEDAGHGDDDVDARSLELIERNQFRAGQAAVAVEARPRAEQRQRLPDRRAFVLEIVGAPQHDRDRLRQAVSFGDVLVDQPLRLQRAVLHRKGAGDPERIEAVQIAPGRQDRRCPQQIAARRRTHELAVERMQDARDFVILRQQDVDRGEFLAELRRCVVGGRQRRCASPRTIASSTALSGRAPCEASATACSISTRCSTDGASPTT